MGISELNVESNPEDFLSSLTDFSKQHRAQRWEGSLGDFLTQILPVRPAALVRTSQVVYVRVERDEPRVGFGL